jgi:CheY-like chemotaxis protein
MGGAFTIESAPGHGTTATLSLPLARSVEDQAPPTGELSRVTRGSHTDDVLRGPLHDQRPTIRVALVDDHAMVRQGLRSVLDAYADIHVIGEARDGIEAVNLVEQHRPRVVVMDLNMPRMNGIEATEHIMRRYPDTIVIGISVNMGDDNSAAMQRAGAATLLTKEAAVEQLHETIVQEVVKHG